MWADLQRYLHVRNTKGVCTFRNVRGSTDVPVPVPSSHIMCQQSPASPWERPGLQVAVPAASPSGKRAVAPRSPARAGMLLHAAHSDLTDYCREGLNTARAPHVLSFCAAPGEPAPALTEAF